MHKTRTILIAAAAGAAVLAAMSRSATSQEADSLVQGWLGSEFTVLSSALEDHVPARGKITFVFDAEEGVYRACTRRGAGQATSWKEDWAQACAVTFQLVKAQRFCTLAEVKAGDQETLAECHRLTSREVAMHASQVKGSVELHETIVFPLQASASGKRGIAMLIDSPARLTHNGVIHAEN